MHSNVNVLKADELHLNLDKMVKFMLCVLDHN